MVNEIIVQIVSERIMNGGINPKTKKVYIIDDVTNTDYYSAIEDYILNVTRAI